MIATIKAEWRKNRFRPAFLVSSAVMAALVVFDYGTNWYLALHPSVSQRAAGTNILTLYPDQFVNNVIGAGYPIGAAIAIVLGALFAGSEYSWGTLKTLLTQRSGRFTTWIGRVVIFEVWMAILTVVLFAVGAASSVVTTAKVVRRSCIRRSTDRARSTNPSYIDWKLRKNSAMSWRNLLPRTRSAS